jgi:membrane protease YdiL (CAAX protease family)
VNEKQKFALVAPIVLIIVMHLIFQTLAGAFGENWRIAWYFGLVIYWLIWGAAFPWLIIGKESIRSIIKPQKLTLNAFLLVLFLLLMAALYKFIPNMDYEKPSIGIFLLVFSTCFGNGFFEEVLWRGTYMRLFPNSIMFRIIWPSIWFALWHYVPGSLNPGGNVVGLIIGSGLMGFYLSFLARKTDTIWWTIIAHTLGGIIMIL